LLPSDQLGHLLSPLGKAGAIISGRYAEWLPNIVLEPPSYTRAEPCMLFLNMFRAAGLKQEA